MPHKAPKHNISQCDKFVVRIISQFTMHRILAALRMRNDQFRQIWRMCIAVFKMFNFFLTTIVIFDYFSHEILVT